MNTASSLLVMLALGLAACGGGDDKCDPTDPSCGDGGNHVTDVTGRWDAVQAAEHALPYDVVLSGQQYRISSATLTLSADHTWRFSVFGNLQGQQQTQLVADHGSYAVRPDHGATTIDFTSEVFQGGDGFAYQFHAVADGTALVSGYDLTDSEGGVVLFSYRPHQCVSECVIE